MKVCYLNMIILIISLIFLLLVIRNRENFRCSAKFNTKYNSNYIDLISKDKINNIVNFIFLKLNKDNGINYRVVSYDDMEVITYKDHTIRYKINLFILDKDNDNSRKVVMDLIDINNKGVLKLMSIKMGKSLDNIIPLPESTTNLVNYNFGYYNINGNTENILDYSFIPKEDLNSSTKYKYNDWIPHKELSCAIKEEPQPFPCRNLGKWWDNDGIKTISAKTKSCIGVNSSTNNQQMLATFNPTLLNRRIDVGNKDIHQFMGTWSIDPNSSSDGSHTTVDSSL